MTLITSISGIRGTIGGMVGDSLSPVDIVRFTTAYANFIKSKQNSIVSTSIEHKNTIVRCLILILFLIKDRVPRSNKRDRP